MAAKANMIAQELGLNRLVSEQPPNNLLDRRSEGEQMPLAHPGEVATIPWRPLAGLAGRYL